MKISKSLLKKIHGAYASLGERPKNTPMNVSLFHCDRWRNPTMSPYHLAAGLKRNDFEAATRFFGKLRPSRDFETVGPYLNVVGTSADIRQAAKLAKAAGWEKRKYDPVPVLNVWEKPLPLELPKGFYFSAGRFSDRKLNRDFLFTMRKNFGTKPKFIREVSAMIKGLGEGIQLVVLYHESGAVAGAGLVATKNGGSFLFCGSICPQYRGRGLWNALVAARQMVSQDRGSEFWITTTGNARIKGKGDHSFPIAVFIPPAN
jgi:hypothetical protein